MMNTAAYTLSQFVNDLRAITAETRDDQQIISGITPLAQQMALSKDWLEERYYACDAKQGFGARLLHEGPDHSPAVFAAAWLPWAVVVGVDGLEKNTFWKRLDDGSRPDHANIKWNGEKVFGAGEVVAFLLSKAAMRREVTACALA